MIAFERDRYGVPASYAKLPVNLWVYAERLVVVAEGHVITQLMHSHVFIVDELDHLPFNHASVALLFHLISKLYSHTSLIITNRSFAEWANIFGEAKITTVLFDRLTRHCHIDETSNDRYRFKNSSTQPKKER